jgi:kynurenine formamidase
MPRLIDLSHPLEPATPPWPGNPPVEVTVLDAIPASRGVGKRPLPGEPRHANVTAFRTCNHTGTHMDAPAHFYHGLPTIEQVPLEQCVGPAVLVDVSGVGPRAEITPSHLIPSEEAIVTTTKLVLRTGWSEHWGRDDYFLDYPVLSEETANWLVARRVHLIGVDTPSVDREPNPAHFAILGSHAVIVENLTNLDRIVSDVFDLIVLPLPLRGLDGSPVRAIARVTA